MREPDSVARGSLDAASRNLRSLLFCTFIDSIVIFPQGVPGAHAVARGLLLDPRVRPARLAREALGPVPSGAPVAAGRAQGGEERAEKDGIMKKRYKLSQNMCLCGL